MREDAVLIVWGCQAYLIIVYGCLSMWAIKNYVHTRAMKRILSEATIAVVATAASVNNLPIITHCGNFGVLISSIMITAFCELLGWYIKPPPMIEADFRKPSGDPAVVLLNYDVWSKTEIGLAIVIQVGVGIGTLLFLGRIIEKADFCDFQPKLTVMWYLGFETAAAIATPIVEALLRKIMRPSIINQTVSSSIFKAHVAYYRFKWFAFDGTYIPSMVYLGFLCPRANIKTVVEFGGVPIVVSVITVLWKLLLVQWAWLARMRDLWLQVEWAF
uniref:Na_H_Exchanger domain-containing protein n=1 Tax=Panagrellus redivivus TaxID=6233 RepID=A0A7E4VLP8_PANRE